MKNKNKTVKFYNGNIKTGDMLTFNKLAGNSVFNGVKGSCGKHCTGCWNTEDWKHSPCYCAKSYVQYSDHIVDSHIINTLAMREHTQETFEELNKQLQHKRTLKTVRIHSAGELESAAELRGWLWLAKQNPKRKFYIYTKAYEIVDEVLSTIDTADIPANMFINVSVWHEHGIACYNSWSHLPIIRAYVYNDGTFDYAAHGLKIDGICPAYKKDANGKVKLSHDLTCDKCGLCFQGKAKVLSCLDH